MTVVFLSRCTYLVGYVQATFQDYAAKVFLKFQATCRQLANQIDISVWNLYLKDSLKSIREKKREWCCNVWRTLIIAIRITARRKLFADGHLMGFEQTVYFAK